MVSLHTPYVISVDGGLFMVMLWYSVPASCAKERLLTAVTAGFFMVTRSHQALPTGVRAILGPPKMGTPGPHITRDMGTGVPEISSDMGTEGPQSAGGMEILYYKFMYQCKRSVRKNFLSLLYMQLAN